jgi:hypothetical protein
MFSDIHHPSPYQHTPYVLFERSERERETDRQGDSWWRYCYEEAKVLINYPFLAVAIC